MKEKYIGTYMKVARLFAEHSSAKRKKVGAVIVKDDRIISIGYNGMPAGWNNDCEDLVVYGKEIEPSVFNNELTHEWKTKPEVLHAESNAIAKLAKSTESGKGATMFVTCAPCLECAKLIYQAGIKEIYYTEDYRKSDGVDFLSKCKDVIAWKIGDENDKESTS
jgi:dCMP deaminase